MKSVRRTGNQADALKTSFLTLQFVIRGSKKGEVS